MTILGFAAYLILRISGTNYAAEATLSSRLLVLACLPACLPASQPASYPGGSRRCRGPAAAGLHPRRRFSQPSCPWKWQLQQ